MIVNTQRHLLRSAAGIAAAITLTLAACGGDDDESTSTTTAPPAADADAATDDAADVAGDAPALSPSALTLADQEGDGTSVVVGSVDLPAPGFIAVHGDAGGTPGPVIGVSDLLPAGTSTDVVVGFAEPLAATGTVFPMVHIDTDGNGIYEFGAVEGVDGPGTTADGDVAVGPVVLTVGGATSDATDEPDATDGSASGATEAITIAEFAFSGVTEVPVGTTVVVTNNDGAAHTWSAVDGAFDSGTLGQGDSFEFTFTEPGEFAYFCNFHPSMTGTITVTG